MSPEAINNYPENSSVAKAYRETIAQWERELASTRTAPSGNRPAFLPVNQPIGIDVAVAWIPKVRDALKTTGIAVAPSFVEFEQWVKAAHAALNARTAVPAPPEFAVVGEWLLTTPLPPELNAFRSHPTQCLIDGESEGMDGSARNRSTTA